MSKQPSCEERIEGRLENYVEEAEAINADFDDMHRMERAHSLARVCEFLMDYGHTPEDLGGRDPQELQEMAQESWSESVLDRNKMHEVYMIQFSCGGPSDHFEVFVDSDGDVVKAEYVFLDWYDGARRRVYSDELIEMLRNEIEYIRDVERA